MKTVNDYIGLTDSDQIEQAVKNRENGIVVIPPRVSDREPERDHWLIDRAILLPENTTVILQNCKIKLSDRCRDNFFRSDNCGLGDGECPPIHNIHIRGEGLCILEGADHPRATGDGSKILANPCPKKPEDICKLVDWVPEERRVPEKIEFWDEHEHSYGTDAGKEGESQYGDWRGVGILFANVHDSSIENLRIVCSHGWGISMEACSDCRIEKIDFDSNMSKMIDGLLSNMENQDGIDLRNGCHDIVISDITGGTGDDLIALTAVDYEPDYKGGGFDHTVVMHTDWTRREKDIYNIIIRNVMGYSKGNICNIIRLLPAGCRIHDVVIDGVVDNSPAGYRVGSVVQLGDGGFYGENGTDGLQNITISNLICDSRDAVNVESYLRNAVITNVVNKNPDCPAVRILRKNGAVNVAISNVVSVSEEAVRYENLP